MILLTPQSKILLSVQPADFRKGMDGLAAICRGILESDPMSGTLYVFINRSRTMIRILTYDGSGFWLMTKRLSSKSFPWWPAKEGLVTDLEAKKLTVLLWGQNPEKHSFSDWKKVS